MRSTFESKIQELLDLYSVEELFEVCDITNEEVVEILLRNGYIKIPAHIERLYDEEELDSSD